MKAMLFAVGCIGLFGSDPTLIARGAISSIGSIQATTKTAEPHSHII